MYKYWGGTTRFNWFCPRTPCGFAGVGIRTTYVLVAVITAFGANCGLGLVQSVLAKKVRRGCSRGLMGLGTAARARVPFIRCSFGHPLLPHSVSLAGCPLDGFSVIKNLPS